jgi:uncharacterized membrane protein
MSVSKSFELGDALSAGWNAACKYFWPYTGIATTWFMITACPALLLWAVGVPLSPEAILLNLFLTLMLAMLNDLVTAGMLHLQLKVLDGLKISSNDIWQVLPVLIRYMVAGLLFKIIVAFGFICFLLPGIMWQIRFQFYGYFVIDKKMGPLEALKASSRLTQGVRMDLFLFQIVQGFIGSLTFVTFGLAAFHVYITNTVACAHVYRQLLAQTEGFKAGSGNALLPAAAGADGAIVSGVLGDQISMPNMAE